MATVWLSAKESTRLPDICVKTGLPARPRLPLEAVDRPAWTYWILLFGGWWVFLLARGFGTERVKVALPVSDVAFRRHCRAQLASLVAFAVGAPVLVVGVIVTSGVVFGFGAGVMVAALIAGAVAEVITRVGLRFDTKSKAIIVRRCHAGFAHAVAESRLALR